MPRFDPAKQISFDVLNELYVERALTAAQIAEELGCGETTVFRALEKYGVPRRSKRDYRLEISQEELEQLYVAQQLSEREIAELFNTSQLTVSRRLREYGIATRSVGPVSEKVVPSQVLTSWSAELAYVVGLIATDGNLNSGRVQVEFISTDRELIALYCSALQLDAIHVSITEYEGRKPWYKVRLNDRIFRQFLESVGLTPAKSKTLGVLAIPDNHFRDFLRGVLDGDGSWYVSNSWLGRYQYLRVELVSASWHFIEWINQEIFRLTGLEGNKRTKSFGRYHYLTFIGQQAIALGNWLYYCSEVLALSRKRIVWEKMLNHSKSRSR